MSEDAYMNYRITKTCIVFSNSTGLEYQPEEKFSQRKQDSEP